MNIISVLHFSSFITNLLLITLVLSRKSGALLNRICAFLIATFAFWSLFSGLYTMAGTNEEATLLLNISSFGWCVTPVASLWFYLALANKDSLLKNKALITTTALVAVAFIYAQWSGNMISESIQAGWGWTGIWKLSIAAYAFYIYYFGASGACIYLIIDFGRKAKTNHQKKQAKLLIITGVTALALATITDVVFRVADIRAVPDVADIFFMIWGIGIVYAVSKYGLMSLTPTVAAETILSTISDSIILLDASAQIVFTNRATTTLLESKDDDLHGASFSSVVKDKKAAGDLLQETLTVGSSMDHELSYLSKNGKAIPVLVSTSVVHDSDNNIVGYVISAKDITRRKQSAELILQEKNFSNAVIDSLPGLFYIINRDGKFLRWSQNDLKVTGYTDEDAPNLNVLDIIAPEDREMISAKMLEVFNGEADTAEINVLTKTGEKIPYHITGKRASIGDETYLLGMGIDITDRKKAEAALQITMDELRYSNEELQQFAYIASHDLQEPLRMVSSYVQLLEKRYKDSLDADAHDFINFAVAGVKRMQSLINDLLQYSRVGTRGKPFENTQCQDVYDAAVTNLKIAIKESGASVSRGNLPPVFGDSGQLIQVLQNLIGNAIKYHNEKSPEIFVGAEKKNGNWVFSVIDNGIGIDPKFFDRIFLIFQRLHGNEYPGTGVGLSIARKIVQRHGGQIWVESKPGKGSTFYFTIPSRKEGGN
jgi:PAS domain S-box-containing protein